MVTDFQKNCEKTILQTLEELGFKQTDRELIGLKESYIKFHVSSTKVLIFIYEDEAGIESPSFSSTYEHWDYKQPSDLIQALDEQLREILIKE